MDGRLAAGPDLDCGDAGGGPLLVVMPDSESVALAVATAIVSEARRVVGGGGEFSVALAGGSTPRRTYELLGRSHFAEQMPWKATHVYWGDERCVSPDDDRSNEAMARAAMLDHVAIPPAQIHPMRCAGPRGPGAAARGTTARPRNSARGAAPTGGEQAAREAADNYEALLRDRDSALDLVLLGLGQDGHTASLFPGSDASRERDRWVTVARQPSAAGDAEGDPPLWRVTLTVPYINQAGAVYFLVTGADKASVLRQVLEGVAPDCDSGGADLPARAIVPASGRLVWFVDEEAAAEVEEARLFGKGRG